MARCTGAFRIGTKEDDVVMGGDWFVFRWLEFGGIYKISPFHEALDEINKTRRELKNLVETLHELLPKIL